MDRRVAQRRNYSSLERVLPLERVLICPLSGHPPPPERIRANSEGRTDPVVRCWVCGCELRVEVRARTEPGTGPFRPPEG